MLVKTSELNGAALDWTVAKALGILRSNNVQMYVGGPYAEGILPNGYCPVAESAFDIPLHKIKYSTDWSQGGPIIERELITLTCGSDATFWCATQFWACPDTPKKAYGPTALSAAMRCYVAIKMGDEVDVPEELVDN